MSNKRFGGPGKRPKLSKGGITTRSGRVLKVNRSLGQKWTSVREAKSLRKVDRMRGLPKSRFKRTLWRLQPRRLADYWFSRDGGIMALKILGIAILLLFVLTLGVFAYFRKDLPKITDVSGSNLGGSISYYDRTGKTLLWQDYNGVKRITAQSQDISPYVKEATVAVEDRDFYNHRGFDLKGIARAAVNDVTHKGSTQGGSTITQQLVKLTQDWQQQRTFTRKVKELILAVELERNYTKDEILTDYLNVAPYGGVDYGVRVASNDYFHKEPKDLTLAEAAMLAAIPKSPSIYSPYNKTYFDKQAFLDRYNYVLDSMERTGKITKTQLADAKKTDVLAEVQPQQNKYAGIQAPYFVLAAKDELTNRFAANGPGAGKIGGWKVITTLDSSLQTKAEQLVASNLSSVRRYTGGVADEEATVTEDVQTGQIMALVGGTDFTNVDHGQINYAHSALVPPGSSFKPYDYTALIENHTNAGAGSVLFDTQGPIPGYSCTIKGSPPPKGNSNCLADYDFLQPGPLTLRYALGGSRNIPAVKAMLSTLPNDTSAGRVDSINKTISTADAMIDNPYNAKAYQCYQQGVDINNATPADATQCYGASAIGDGAFLHLDDHVNGLATLARLGSAIPRTYIMKVTDAANKTIYEYKQPKGDQVVRPDTAYIVDNMASDPNASYLPGSCSATSCSSLPGGYKFHRYNGWNFAIKTGTTNNGFDGLMTSWSTKYAVASWVGNHTRNVNLGGPGMEYLTEPLTRGMMEAAHANQKAVNWAEPSDIQHLPAFVVHNHVHYGDVEPSPSTEIYPSWYKGPNGNTQNATIDKVSNKLATNCTPGLAKQNVGGDSNANHFSIDIFFGAGISSTNGSTSANDDVHNCSDAKPTITLTASCQAACTFTATASQGTHPLNDPQYAQFPGTINFMVNGQVVKTVTFSDTSVTTQSVQYTPTGSGSASVSAQVIDSVLYDATSDSQTVNFAPAAAALTFVSANVSGGSTTFTWSGGTGPFTVFKTTGNVNLCSTTSTSCSSSSVLAPHGTSVYVKDSTGATANGTVN